MTAERREARRVTFWGEFLKFLDKDMAVPTLYGWFHILFFALSVAAGVLLCKYKKPTDQFANKLVLFTALLPVLKAMKLVPWKPENGRLPW